MRRSPSRSDTVSAETEAERLAAFWFVRRQSERNAQDDAAFEHWLAQSETHWRAYRQIADTWQALGDLPAEAIARLRSEHGGRAPPVRQHANGRHTAASPGSPASDVPPVPPASFSRRAFVPRFALAGTACAAVAGGALGWKLLRDEWQSTPTFAQRYDTRRGEFQTVSLPDGSTIQLDTDTHVQARLYPDRREVQVLRGQAMFSVHADATAPFQVLARSVTVTVVGTRFAVRSTETGVDTGNVRIAVEEGRVRVAAGAMPSRIELTAGQTVATDAHGMFGAIASISPNEVATWREGRVRFDNTTLARAVQELERYMPTHIVIADPSIASLRLTGSFDVQKLAAFVQALPRVLPVRVRTRGGVTEIVRTV